MTISAPSSASLVLRSSLLCTKALTLYPFSNKNRVTFDPVSPVAPVTKNIFDSMIFSNLYEPAGLRTPSCEIRHSLRHIVDCRLQFFIEHLRYAVDVRILKLSEQGRRKVILDDTFLWAVLSNVDPKGSVKSRSNVLLRHLERKERISNDVLFRSGGFSRQAGQPAMIDHSEDHQAKRTFYVLHIISCGTFRHPACQLLVKGAVIEMPHTGLKSCARFLERFVHRNRDVPDGNRIFCAIHLCHVLFLRLFRQLQRTPTRRYGL